MITFRNIRIFTQDLASRTKPEETIRSKTAHHSEVYLLIVQIRKKEFLPDQYEQAREHS